MSAYNNTASSNYDLHGAGGDNGNHDLLTQQQQHHHPHAVSPVQPYPFDPQHHVQPQPYDGQTNGHVEELQQDLSGNADEKQRWKGSRLRKACDSCSIRKVRCDESGPPCLACAALDIPCTFERPSRRRGPPNRHAEAIKRRKPDDSPTASAGFSSPTSPNNVAATLASFSSHAVLSAESICPFSTLELLVDDFFTYIHPLVPFPHEPSFRAAFKHREDLNNPPFLALLAAMVGALVASFPRRPKLHLKHQHRENLFPNSISLVERCHKVAVEARGPGYLDKDLTVYDAATSYLLALAGAYVVNYRQCRLYFGETLTILRVLGAHKVNDPGNFSLGQPPITPAHDITGHGGQMGEPVDFIRQEIGRRIFWCTFVGIRSMQQLGASFSELIIPPPTPSEPLPQLPREVDDAFIYVSHIDPQPAGIISEITGFNLGINIYMTCTPLATMELAYGIDEVFDWNRQKRVLEKCLQDVKRVLDDAPKELLLAPGSQPGEFEGQDNRLYYPQPPDFAGNTDTHRNFELPSYVRKQLQYEIQKANIYASQLGTRSYLVEKYWNLLDAYESRIKGRDSNATSPISQSSPGVIASGLDGLLRGMGSSPGFDVVESHMNTERENVVKDLLRVLGSISQVNMEPNGGSFINKIRQIASTLLDTPRNRKGPLALKAEEYLARFLDVLMKLERFSPTKIRGSGGGENGYAAQQQGASTQQDLLNEEEEELRNWADLREFQNRFASSGGFLNEF